MSAPDRAALAKALRDRRGTLFMTQAQAAETAGISSNGYRRFETEESAGQPRPATKAGLERAMMWPRGMVDRLLEGDTDPATARDIRRVIEAPEEEPITHECRYCGYEGTDPERFNTYRVYPTSGPVRSIFDEGETEYLLCSFCERSYMFSSFQYGTGGDAANAVRDVNAALNVHLDMVADLLRQNSLL